MAADYWATVGGDWANTASGNYATVCGGYNNTASGAKAFACGGSFNTASGEGAAVLGGHKNTASGKYSFVAGYQATAKHDGSFVWGDATSSKGIASTGENQFVARASGGVWLYADSDASTGVKLSGGSGAWASVSDANLKANFAVVDGREVLARLAAVPIRTWNYKTQDESIRHIGPVAQDFYAAFGVGEDDKHISTVDADGVALAAIQGLYELGLEKVPRSPC